MSRTRGASKGFHQDDGVVLGKGGVPIPTGPGEILPVALDKQGRPISPAAAYLRAPMRLDGDYVPHGAGAEPLPARREVVAYKSDRTTWTRAMEPFDLAMLIDMALRNPGRLADGLVVEVSPLEFMRLSGNLKLHFRPVFE